MLAHYSSVEERSYYCSVFVRLLDAHGVARTGDDADAGVGIEVGQLVAVGFCAGGVQGASDDQDVSVPAGGPRAVEGVLVQRVPSGAEVAEEVGFGQAGGEDLVEVTVPEVPFGLGNGQDPGYGLLVEGFDDPARQQGHDCQ